jgi:enoyl-CoA hydratase
MIHCERQASSAVVTLRGEDENNLLSLSATRDLTRIFTSLKSDPCIRAIILTGSGDRAFSIGVDLAAVAPLTPERAIALAREWQSLLSLIGDLGKPVIAAVNGAAFGAGCDLALACAWRVASANAEFAYPNPAESSALGFGDVVRLSRMIGQSRALEMILTGKAISGEDALRIGLATRVVRNAEDLRRVCDELVGQISRNAPLAVKYALEAVNHRMDRSLDDGLLLESALFGLCFATADAREGTSSFLEKRPPDFKGV